MSWPDITPEDIIRIEQEAEAFLEREPDQPKEPWDSHGFRNARDYWEFILG